MSDSVAPSSHTGKPRVTPGVVAGGFDSPEFLGEGGMGEVWKAVDRSDGAVVAVKVVRPALLERLSMVARFRRETEVMARVRHPCLVGLREVLEGAGGLALVLDFIDGESLADRLKRGPMPPLEAVTVIRDVAAGLAAVHAEGVVHRDLKPENIMVRPDGRGVLMDFGLAGYADDAEATALTRTGELLGTMLYMPPEMFLGQRSTSLSDQYQLGLVLHRALTGQLPFVGGDVGALAARASGQLRPFPGLAGSAVDAGLRRVVIRAMEREPQDRFPSMEAFGAALEGWRRGAADTVPSLLAPASRSRSPWTLLCAVVIVVLLLVGAGAALWRGEGEVAEPSAVATAPAASAAPALLDPASARAAWEAELNAFVEEARTRASSFELRHPPEAVPAAEVQELVLQRLRSVTAATAAASDVDALDRERRRFVGLLDLALRGPRPADEEDERQRADLLDVVEVFSSTFRGRERRILRETRSWIVAETGALPLTERLTRDITDLVERERRQGRFHPVEDVMALEVLLGVDRNADAAALVADAEERWASSPARTSVWFPRIRLVWLYRLIRLRAREGKYAQVLSLLEAADESARGVTGPPELRTRVEHLRVSCHLAIAENLVRSRTMTPEGQAAGLAQARRSLESFDPTVWKEWLHLPVIAILEREGHLSEARELRARYGLKSEESGDGGQ